MTETKPTQVIDEDKPIPVKRLLSSSLILDLYQDEALQAGLIFSYHIFVPDPIRAMYFAVEKAISKIRSTSKDKKQILAAHIYTFLTRWVNYRLRRDFRRPLPPPVDVKKKRKSTQLEGKLIDHFIAMLDQMRSDEVLGMVAYRVKISMLKTSQSKSDWRKRRNRPNLLIAASGNSSPNSQLAPTGSSSSNSIDNEKSDRSDSEANSQEGSTAASAIAREMSGDAIEATDPTEPSDHSSDPSTPMLCVTAPQLPTLDDDDERSTNDEESDSSVDSDVRRARGIVPSLSFFSLDELEDAATSDESDSSSLTVSTPPGSDPMASSPSVSSSESISIPTRGSSPYLMEDPATRMRFAHSPDTRRSRASTTIKKQSLQAILLRQAEELTLIENELLQAIRPMEFFKVAWQKEDKQILAPNITNNVRHFSSLSFWVSRTLCEIKSVESRIAVLKQHLSLAELCFQLSNFNSLMAIIGGLSNAAVRRMKQTWAGIGASYTKLWKRLNVLMDTKQNYAKYRQALRDCEINNRSAIPFLGVILRDIAFIEEGQEDYADPKQKSVNAYRFRLLGNVLIQFEAYLARAAEYEFPGQRTERKFWRANLTPVPVDADDLLYEKSCEVEPKQQQQPQS